MKTEIIKNEWGLFELHIDEELCVVKKTKKEINQFLEETNKLLMDMNKSIIKLALDALELKLIKQRQEAKREGMFYDVESINVLLEKAREYQKELESIEGETLTILL